MTSNHEEQAMLEQVRLVNKQALVGMLFIYTSIIMIGLTSLAIEKITGVTPDVPLIVLFPLIGLLNGYLFHEQVRKNIIYSVGSAELLVLPVIIGPIFIERFIDPSSSVLLSVLAIIILLPGVLIIGVFLFLFGIIGKKIYEKSKNT